ncbi:hypothetical protein [Streptomyces sp. 11x1]|uniref:hypothetical protein n=1 Tax=Streptomyces sp. 11x1 TaxID=3038642 RepID=UPI00292D4A4A|nr:hypothetical protein [Streptomyces sp. 11x1]WNZ10621.1 hypothetical protein P8T65_25640 [Streptomyces sp. 11x1]
MTLAGQDALLPAIRAVLAAGRVHGLGLADAQHVVRDRYLHHGDRVARTPDSPLDLDSLTALATGLPSRLVAIEAVWDGDTVHDWFVILLAHTADPEGEHPLATTYWGTAERHLGADRAARTPGHPSAEAATHAGRALAAHLSVPFRFASPDTPDEEARWER